MEINRKLEKEQSTKPKIKKVASNSILLFFRVLVLAIINLYAVRLMLNALGKDDYGLYNAIAGVVTLSVILITLFALPIQRFYSFSMGKGEKHHIEQIFSASINMLAVLSLLLLIIFETIGINFVSHKMTIPPERMNEALITFHFTIVTFLFSLLQVPFLAMILANEDMGLYSLVSCIDSFLKFICAYLIAYAPIDKLIFYSISLLLVAAITFTTYAIICKSRYTECSYCKVTSRHIYAKILSFIGWTSLGSFSGVGLIQGSIIMLNIFFGPLANAAFGIANNIYNALMSLGNSAIVAFRPSTIKSYAAEDMDSLNKLFNIGNKFLIYLLLAIAIPLGIEMKQILTWWLGTYDSTTVTFCRLFMIYGIVICIGTPISNIVQASGRVKKYYLSCELIVLLHLPIAYTLFSINMPAYYIYISMIGVCTISHAIRVALLKSYYPSFSQRAYYLKFLLPAIVIATVCVYVSLLIHETIEMSITRTMIIAISSPTITFLLAITFATEKKEKLYIKKIAKKFLSK